MSQDMGGQGAAGGANLDEIRRRLQGAPATGDQQRRPIGASGPDVMPGGQNPAPPSAPVSVASPVQQPMVLKPQQDALAGMNPYQPQGGTGPKSAQPNDTGGTVTATGPQGDMQRRPIPTSMPPGAPIGPGAPGTQGTPRPSNLEMTGKPAGGQFPQAPAGGRRPLGPESRPTPQNPSPQGPQGIGGPMLRPAVGGAPVGGWTAPNWGVAGSGSAGVGNLPSPTPVPQPAPQPALSKSDQATLSLYGGQRAAAPAAGGMTMPANPYAPTGGGQPAGNPSPGYQPGAPLGNDQPRRQVGPSISGGGPGGASI